MRARLVNMGNSRGVRLPKPLIEQMGLGDEVEVRVRKGGILITAVTASRAGWADAAARVSASDSVGLLDPPVATRFDDAEWRW